MYVLRWVKKKIYINEISYWPNFLLIKSPIINICHSYNLLTHFFKRLLIIHPFKKEKITHPLLISLLSIQLNKNVYVVDKFLTCRLTPLKFDNLDITCSINNAFFPEIKEAFFSSFINFPIFYTKSYSRLQQIAFVKIFVSWIPKWNCFKSIPKLRTH